MFTTNTFDLNNLKPLTTEQYDRAQAKALARVQTRIGGKPTRAEFQRELGSLFTLLDGLALAVFVPALILSSIHIIEHMGALANASYGTLADYSAGTIITRDFYAAAHQWATVPLAESSMLLFLVMFGLKPRGDWRKWVFLALAAVATLFILIANAQSGLGALESLLPPIFTIGVGLHLEGLIVRQLQRREDVNTRYLAALATWETASADATKHPDFTAILKQEVWAALISLTSNRAFADAPAAIKHAAVCREMARDTWAFEDAPAAPATPAAPDPATVPTPAVPQPIHLRQIGDDPLAERPLPVTALRSNGNGNGNHHADE